jgi:hypothetical protein
MLDRMDPIDPTGTASGYPPHASGLMASKQQSIREMQRWLHLFRKARKMLRSEFLTLLTASSSLFSWLAGWCPAWWRARSPARF